jgi:hypothetical protein
VGVDVGLTPAMLDVQSLVPLELATLLDVSKGGFRFLRCIDAIMAALLASSTAFEVAERRCWSPTGSYFNGY